MTQRKRARYERRLLLLKSVLLISVTATLFILLSVHNFQVLRLSRTAGIMLVTYSILLPVLLHIYHSFEIGRRDRLHIISTTSVSIVMADLVTYLQLLIMNVNENNRDSLRPIPEEVGCLLMAMVIQVGLVALFAHMALRLYEKYNPPRRTCLICPSEADARFIRMRLKPSARRYRIDRTLYYGHADLYSEIPKYDQIFLYNLPMQERYALVEYCYKLSKPVSYNMEIADIIGYGAGHDMFEDVSFVSADNRRALSIEQKIMKRAFDLIITVPLLVLLSPVMLLCALGIRLCDGGSVLFRQKRATIGGRVFTICKFRTMRENADPHHSVQVGDDRITPVGRFLRKTRLDELPQLFNILQGDMSLVGPRPEMLSNVESYTQEVPEFSYRLAVKAGLTGYAQIAGKYNTAPKEKMMMDLMYIEDYSIWRDIKLLLQTVTVFFRSEESTAAFENKPSDDDIAA